VLGPLGAWLKEWCQSKLRAMSAVHLIKNSSTIVAPLSSSKYRHNIVAVKLDIRDYFLTGTPAELKSIALRATESAMERDIVSKVLDILLMSQFITLGDSLHSVSKGAGMGLNYAGELADLVLCLLAEPFCIGSASRTFSSASVLHFYRFKDDVLLICQDDHHWKGWVNAYFKRARPYVIKAEAVSRQWVPFLDLGISLHNGDNTSYITVAPYTKPTSSKIVLAADSGHTSSIHLSWPRCEAERIRAQCSSSLVLKQHFKKLRNKFTDSGASSAFVTELFRDRPLRVPPVIRPTPLWFVTAFEPTFKLALSRAVSAANRDANLLVEAFGGGSFILRLSYRNHGQCLAKLLADTYP
jgi:hypothetical protein